MGDKRMSVRTLPSGEKVHHMPPDPQHPEGVLRLIRDRSPLREKLAAMREKKKQRHRLIHAQHLQRIEVKRALQRAGGLPPDKSVV